MGLDIILKNVSLRSQALGYAAAVTDGLLGWWFLGGDLEQSCQNLAGGDGCDVIGTPTVQTNYLSLKSNNNYLRMPFIDEAATGTAIVVGRGTDTNADNPTRPVFIGSGGSISKAGFLLQVASGSSFSLTTYEDVSGTPTQNFLSHTSTPNAWRMIMCDFSDTNQNIYNLTAGTSNSETRAEGVTRIPGTGRINIGSAEPGSSLRGTLDVAMAAYYNRQLTSDERTAIYNQVKTYMGNRSITI